MEIKTRFNIGYRVWVIEFVNGIKYVKGKAYPTKVWFISYEDVEITGFNMMRIENEKIGIFVNLKDTNLGYLESECFATQAKAQAECDKRNKGE